MTREELIALAREAGLSAMNASHVVMSHEQFERFAALVAEREREACAKVCDEVVAKIHHQRMFGRIVSLDKIAAAIRARGEAT